MEDIDFNKIRPVNGSLGEGFEEFVCQLARKEPIPGVKRFVRNGKPDGGLECYCMLDDGSIIGWQAKFFCKAFDASQYQQIDRSVKTAIESYPKLSRYIIAVPVDPPNAHVSGQVSMMERVEDYIGKWHKAYSNVAFEFWWASNLIERLQNPYNFGLFRFWFGKNVFSDDYLSLFNKKSILDLGKRYTPKLNIDVSTAQYFSFLSRDKCFQTFLNAQLENVDNACTQISRHNICDTATDKIESIKGVIKSFKDRDILGIDTLPVNQLLASMDSLAKAIDEIYISQDSFAQSKGVDGKNSRELLKLAGQIRDVYYELNDDKIRLANDPILLLEGDAGVGKSHLLADVVKSRENERLDSLLFLGQKFTTNEQPDDQMKRQLDFNGTFEELLATLEAKAMLSGHRLIVFIDAINEGNGLNIWPNSIRSFIEDFRCHPWLGLVLSIRSSYVPAIIPQEELGRDICVRALHNGFGSNTYKAVRLYFREYNILYPSVPLLNPEFRNPLFLRLFCEGLQKNGYQKIPDGIRGISSVIKMFFVGVEKSIKSHVKCSPSITFVENATNRYIKYLVEKRCHQLPLNDAVTLLSDICPRTFSEGELVDLLISDGVFSKDVCYSEGGTEECIYLTYERFENILQAEYIIDDVKGDTKELGSYIFQTLETGHAYGMLEALAILLPERLGMELYEILPSEYQDESIAYAVLYSLVWRDAKTINSKLKDYFKQFYEDNEFMYQFVLTLIEIGFISENYFNANYLHKCLSSMKLADRDAVWIPVLYQIYRDQDNILDEIINWVLVESNKIDINDEYVILCSTLLAWLLASSNRKLRDTATKALIQLLNKRMHLLIPLLEKFRAIDDPYILERLYCVTYGTSIRSTSKAVLKEVSQYVYSSIFDTEGEIYPHVLLRDYARGIIEYTISIGIDLNFDLSRIRPPYNSKLEIVKVTEEDIISLIDKIGTYNNSPGICSMITSMMPEHCNRLMYGDFGRYTFQNALSNWKSYTEEINYMAIKYIIDKYGYSEEKHGGFDKIIGSGRGRTTIPNERIGKKYQWLVFFELLARFSDNYPQTEGFWSMKEVCYEGPWKPFVRDIDPTTLVRINENSLEDKPMDAFWWSGESYENWDYEMRAWLDLTNDLPPLEPIISVIDLQGVEWLALECYPSWEEPHGRSGIFKSLWYQVRSCIVNESDFERIYEWLKVQDFGGRWMPESSQISEVFYREFYWSPGYMHYDIENLTKATLQDKIQNIIIGDIELTSVHYLWEAEEDYSKAYSYSYLMPSKQLFDGLGMQFSDQEGVFCNESGKTICYDTSAVDNSKSHLLVRKDALLSYLQDNHKRILWYVLGEKNIVGYYNTPQFGPLSSWPVFSGTYILSDDNMLVGNISVSRR